ncbi:MAG: ketoacyl-ACP synthase III [Peptococcaceae bacterium]|jgi:3-oxoacyl-[acyl-carrier-protein] synthase-3|nr:ketoacyl-ACP synthase III [Peptococcaceae bacterium]
MHKRVGGAGIWGLGRYLPERVLTNAELERMVETNDEWIVSRTGIRERRIAAGDQTTTDLALPASRQAMERAGVTPEDLDLIIFCTNNPDTVIPAAGPVLQGKLGATRAGAFDLVAGCSGYIYGLSVASQFAASRTYLTILVVGADMLSRVVDWQDRTTCVLFGDGAGAAVVRPVPDGRGILSFRLACDGTKAGEIIVPAGGASRPATHGTVDAREHYLRMNGREVFRFAVTACEKVAREVLDAAAVSAEDVALFVPHQANLRIIENSARRLGIGMDRVMVNVDRYGNSSAATIPVALAEAEEQGRLKQGDLVLLVGFGAGLTYAGMVIRW